MKTIPLALLFCLPLFFVACGSSENTQRESTIITETGDYSQFRSLADYLRRVPGVQVSGAGNNVHIQIRGISSLESETRPLYIIDGRIMGNSYAEVNRILDMREVSRIVVLSDSEASGYGVRGSNGVIEITLKR